MKKLFIFLITVFFLYTCNTTKYVPKGEQLLVKNTIVLDDSKKDVEHLEDYLVQRPNYRLLGIPASLYFYNLGNPKGAEKKSRWKKEHPKTYNTVSKLFSEKQAKSFAQTFIDVNQWFLNNGEAPIIISKQKTKKTERNLKAHLQNKGYFEAKVSSKVNKKTPKKAEITYYLTKGKPIFIDSISYKIKSPALDSLYKRNLKNTFLKKKQYNNQDFINEAKRLTTIFRNNGIYHFSKNDISFNIDTIGKKYRASVETFIRNRKIDSSGTYISKPYKIQKIKTINVYTDFVYTNENYSPKMHESYKGIKFWSENKLKYKPKHLTESIFIRPNQIYSDERINATRTHLRSLKNFKTINIKYNELNDTELEVNIYLTPSKPFTQAISTALSRSNIRIRELSAEFSFISKNTFRGTEMLKVSGFGSFFKTEKNNGWEFGGDVSLEVPRFMMPFGINRLVKKKMFPKTRFFTGASVQKNIGLDRYIFNLGVEYKWKFTHQKFIQLELLNTQFIKHYNVFRYFDIYRSEYDKLNEIADIQNTTLDSDYTNTVDFMNSSLKNSNLRNQHPEKYRNLQNVVNRHNIITSDFLLLISSYSFTFNGKENLRDHDFSYFKIRLANSGLGLGFLIKEENKRDKSTAFQIPIAQYVKLDAEYKKFFSLSPNSVLGIRLYGGIIFPYNNSDIPFSKSYFAGGSNDIRAWRTYQLGPGNTRGLEYNVGNLKLLGNLEYRFDVIGDFKGALFVDAGNIWNIFKTGIEDTEAEIKHNNPFKSIAMGTGFGIRYDFKFLVGRLDLGFKVLEPYYNENKWFRNFNFKESVLNIGINYPF